MLSVLVPDRERNRRQLVIFDRAHEQQMITAFTPSRFYVGGLCPMGLWGRENETENANFLS